MERLVTDMRAYGRQRDAIRSERARENLGGEIALLADPVRDEDMPVVNPDGPYWVWAKK